MELNRALQLQTGAALESLIQTPTNLGITHGVMYFLTENPKSLYLQDFVSNIAKDEPCGAIFTVKNDNGNLVSLSYAFFKLSGTF